MFVDLKEPYGYHRQRPEKDIEQLTASRFKDHIKCWPYGAT